MNSCASGDEDGISRCARGNAQNEASKTGLSKNDDSGITWSDVSLHKMQFSSSDGGPTIQFTSRRRLSRTLLRCVLKITTADSKGKPRLKKVRHSRALGPQSLATNCIASRFVISGSLFVFSWSLTFVQIEIFSAPGCSTARKSIKSKSSSSSSQAMPSTRLRLARTVPGSKRRESF